GTSYLYRLLAFSRGEAPLMNAAAEENGITLESVEQELILERVPLQQLLKRGTHQGPASAEGMPLLMPQHVLEETQALKDQAGGCETGGALIGHLRRDVSRFEVFLEVTAQVPALHTEAKSMSLTFTPDTWTAVQNAIDVRGAGELMVGWWHSHPARIWCQDCEPSRWQSCPLARSFFSSSDRNFHRMVFPRAYSVAHVVGDQVLENRTWQNFHAVYGWQRGTLQQRGYYEMERPRAAARKETATGARDG
ncbi:MAG: hypothetical protein V3T77_00635, partial [Planctomycetota bacterium]